MKIFPNEIYYKGYYNEEIEAFVAIKKIKEEADSDLAKLERALQYAKKCNFELKAEVEALKAEVEALKKQLEDQKVQVVIEESGIVPTRKF